MFGVAFAVSLAVGEFCAVFLGAPLVAFARGRLRPSPGWGVLGGASIAAAPWIVYGLMERDIAPDLGAYWLNFVPGVAGLGAIGGLCFWLIAARYVRTTALNNS